jgi:hypothetical protein
LLKPRRPHKVHASDAGFRFSTSSGTSPEPKLKFVRQWLREKEIAHQKRENDIFCFTKKTFYAAIAAVILGIIGLIATLLH